jgi:predicted PurR-regulated permease PerM
MKNQLMPREIGVSDDNGTDAMPLPAPVLRTPVDVSSVSLAVLATLAVIFALQWAQAVFIPLMLGVMISYALSPLVNVMEKWHVPRVLGAAVLLLAIVGGSGYAVYSLSDDAAKLIESLPKAAQKLRQAQVKERGAPVGAMEKVQIAATQIENAAIESGSPAPAAPKGVTRVQVERPHLIIKDYLWMGTKGAIGFAGQLSMVLFLAYFIMVSGKTFRRKMVKITGPSLSKKKITLRVLTEITGQIQRYLMVQLFISILVGVLTWLAFLWIGLENAAIWGIAAGVFKTIPYLGSIVIAAGTALVAFLQFGTIGMALTVSGVSLLVTGVEGYLLTPWLTGRASRMSALVVFAGVLFWGWLWGVWGLLLGVPIIMIVKAICDRVEALQPIGELLGD